MCGSATMFHAANVLIHVIGEGFVQFWILGSISFKGGKPKRTQEGVNACKPLDRPEGN